MKYFDVFGFFGARAAPEESAAAAMASPVRFLLDIIRVFDVMTELM